MYPLFQFLSLLLLIQLKPSVKTSILLTFIFLKLTLSPPSSETSLKKTLSPQHASTPHPLFVITIELLLMMTSFSSSIPYPASTTAYPLLNRQLDSYSWCRFFKCFNFCIASVHYNIGFSVLHYEVVFFSAAPISSLPSGQHPSNSTSSTSSPLPLVPLDAVTTSSHLQQHSAVRQLTRELQRRKPQTPVVAPK